MTPPHHEDRPVRDGERLDLSAVDRWLRSVTGGLDGLPEVTQYRGGVSNWTYRLRYPGRDLILRRPPAGTKAASAHDMGREYRLQAALAPHFPYVPGMVGLCTDTAVLGCEFYVMERVPGLIPRANIDAARVTPSEARRMCEALIDRWVDLHKVNPDAGLGDLYKGPGYARRQVEGWSHRYTKARTWNVPSFARVSRWLAERVPDDVGACVIHNDWRLDNLVFDPDDLGRVVAALDWELATIGDPLMDLGSALAYWVHADDPWLFRITRRQPTHLLGMFRREELVERYLAKTGLSTRDWAFYEVFGLFRLAGIAQQIYYRYHHRQTRNPAFRRFWILVNYFDWRCRAIIRRAPG